MQQLIRRSFFISGKCIFTNYRRTYATMISLKTSSGGTFFFAILIWAKIRPFVSLYTRHSSYYYCWIHLASGYHQGLDSSPFRSSHHSMHEWYIQFRFGCPNLPPLVFIPRRWSEKDDLISDAFGRLFMKLHREENNS